jgi:NAD(P)-dependent dehydrogenase (short-subunit alcohol dehydrogenase family)
MSKKIALVTGSSRGIGKTIAEQLERDGILVLTPTRSELDLMSNQSIDAYLTSLRNPVEILVNDAGINPLGVISELADTDMENTLQVNLKAPIRLARGVISGMRQNNFGRIVNISSIFSLVSKPGRLVYIVSKAGLNGFTRSLAVELAPYNILVNAVAPGYINTELTKQNNTEEDIRNIRKMIPLQRLAEPIEVARLVSFLCSEENTYLTGQCLVIDGGFTCI